MEKKTKKICIFTSSLFEMVILRRQKSEAPFTFQNTKGTFWNNWLITSGNILFFLLSSFFVDIFIFHFPFVVFMCRVIFSLFWNAKKRQKHKGIYRQIMLLLLTHFQWDTKSDFGFALIISQTIDISKVRKSYIA